MPIKNFISIAFMATCLHCYALAQVVTSQAMREVLLRQGERAKAGNRDTTAFLAELKPLADSGDPIAQFMLGTQLMNSSLETGLAYLEKSAKAGCAGAAGILAVYYAQSDQDKSKDWAYRAARGGDAGSTFMLATHHERGTFGLQKSVETSLALYQVAMTQAYSKPMTAVIEVKIKELKSTLSQIQLSRVAELYTKFSKEFPKVAFYIGGQSLP